LTGNRRPARIALALAVAALVLAPTALADKGGKAGGGGSDGGSDSSSLSLVLLNSADGLPYLGQQVTFDVSTAAERPQVNAQCYQNGERVYDEWHGFFEGAMFGRTFTLGPTPSWQGGDADCTARLVTYSRNGRLKVLATTSFHVYA
jgi:hypothetical protein